jgi:hypothetical protein
MRIRWLVRSVESKSYLREYNVVGVMWCNYSCNCTWVYIGKLNTLHKIMSLQGQNKWEPNILTNSIRNLVCTAQHTRRLWVQDLEWLCPCYLHFLHKASATAWFISLIYDLHEPGVSSSLGHRVPAAVNISIRHTTSIFLSKTKVYGYKIYDVS